LKNNSKHAVDARVHGASQTYRKHSMQKQRDVTSN